MTTPHRHRPALPTVDPRRLLVLARRSQQALLIAGVTGAATGLAVAGFERLTFDGLFGTVLDLPVALQAVAPTVGLVLAFACLRFVGRGASPATSDEYIRAFHDQGRRMDLRAVPGRLLAAAATLGGGVPLGYEGPSLYAGAAIGSALQRRLQRYFTVDESKLLLVAGAAAGVAAIFKAPVTGLVFALEVPYQEDLARRMLLPAAISAAAAYVTFAAFAGTEPILPVGGQAPFNLVDLGGAAVVGLAAGVLARAFIALIHLAKRWSTKGRPLVRAVLGGGVLAATVVLGYVLADRPLTLGPGYNALRWALDPRRSVLGIVALGTLRVVGTAAAIFGGAVGGLFIPLVIQGALVGRAVGGIFDPGNATLFPVVGMAAFLGAGYRVPLASVVFVAEFTGRPGFVVPGLIAAVVAQLVMGRASISPYQVAGRVGHLEKRLSLPLATLVDAAAHTVPPDATAEELFWQHMVGTRQRSVAVVDGSSYVGMVRAEDLAKVDRDAWPTTMVTEVMRTDLPVAAPTWTVADAIRAMEAADADRLAMCDDGRFAGMITAEDIVRLDDILRETSRSE
ncbi:MAG TPA: chloride channel protein [Acidimicrobiales bacterium]|nr:chloride channel protein [Acidimicrobiales bacterium]